MAPATRETHADSLYLTRTAIGAGKVFGSTYGVLTLLKCLKMLLSTRRRYGGSKRLQSEVKDIIRNLESIKISTFIALYPALYKLIRRYQHHQALPPIAQTSSIASISLLPLVLLLPSSITTHLNLYSFSALAVSIANKAELDGHLTRIPRWLKKGGGWWLFPLAQGWLLYLSVFEPHTFPDTYRRVIVNRSTNYLPVKPNAPSPNSLITLLPLFTIPPSYPKVTEALSLSHLAPFHQIIDSAHPAQVRALCATLHPDEPGCMSNAVKAVVGAWPGSAGLVGGYTGLMLLLRGRKMVLKDPRKALLMWANATVRGASFISLSISTAWAMTCLFQRLFPPSLLRRSRFSLGGFIAGLWIFLVPSSRRLELGMYTLRLSLLSGWKLGLSKSWWKRWRYLHGLPFVVCFAMLLGLRQRDKGAVDGWVGRAIGWLERDTDVIDSSTKDVTAKTDNEEEN